MICYKCKAVNEDTFKFCNHCGTRLNAPKFESAKQEAHLVDKSTSKYALGNLEYGKVMLAMAIVLVFIISAAISSAGGKVNSEPEPSESARPFVSPSDLLTPEELATVSEALCPSLKESYGWSTVDLVRWVKDARQNTPFVKDASKNAWDSAKWKKNNPSWFEGSTYSDQINSAVQSTVASNLGEQVGDLLDANEFDGYLRNRVAWTDVFIPLVVKNCGYKKAVDEIANYDGYLDKISISAANIPWYPKGFTEIAGYPGFAFKSSNRGCSYTFGSCATIRLVSQTDCPTNLYVEMNLLNNDVVVDWGNDTARIRANQIAEMEISFNGDGDTTEFTKINCY